MKKLEEYRKYWADKFKREEEDKKYQLSSLRRSAGEAARMLAGQFAVKKVYLYGSAVDGLFFHKHSDIDLAVEGLPPRKYLSALAKISEFFQGKVRVDLLPLEDVLPEVKKRIETKGERLYG